MKYLRLYESFDEIDTICKKYKITGYTINPDGSIDVKDAVILDNNKLTKIPIQFNKVNGYFQCSINELITLEGAPKEVNGWVGCSYNNLTSFQYAPRIIGGIFDCRNNNIKTFEYFPRFVDEFWCSGNLIYYVWELFEDWTKIELLNDFDIFRNEDTDTPAIVMDRLNDFLLEIGKEPVEYIKRYKNI